MPLFKVSPVQDLQNNIYYREESLGNKQADLDALDLTPCLRQ